jgi:hypothetical protein
MGSEREREREREREGGRFTPAARNRRGQHVGRKGKEEGEHWQRMASTGKMMRRGGGWLAVSGSVRGGRTGGEEAGSVDFVGI